MKRLILIGLLVVLLTACFPETPLPPAAMPEPEVAGVTASPTEEPQPAETESPETMTLTVLYTNDEHGWMLGEEPGQGAAELTGLWATEYADSDAVLILSGGDNWTGPAISTWFEGESMVQVMNAMGYAASAVGNHEFDFDLDVMKTRYSEAAFPYLGANIRYKSNGEIPTNLGIHPYAIVEVAGLNIGLIGLANFDTPSVTNPVYVSEFDFLDYDLVLREYVPEVRAAGADLIFVPGHICTWELVPLARDVADLGIDFFGGGHCNEEFSQVVAGAVLVSGGSSFQEYGHVTFEIALPTKEILAVSYGVEDNVGGTAHPQVAEIVAHWQAKTNDELNLTIGYLTAEIPQRSEEMAALIAESWLGSYPADVALTNWGGMRDRIPAGEISFSDIISVMPFSNVLVDVELTGAQLRQVLSFGNGLPPVGGLHYRLGKWIMDKTGEPLDDNTTYALLTTDFLYAGGSDYTMLAEFDPEAYNTSISWRQPVIDWILAQESTPENPLDEAISALLDQ
jgi:5'-nucleotidase / UDP-sugar diphosphatase